MARIDQLNEEEKEILRAAAVIGRNFNYRVLKEISRPQLPLDEILSRLENANLIRNYKKSPEAEFLFESTLTQEVVYGSILFQDRKELHTRVGDTMEKLYPGRLHDLAGQIAFHYAQAEVWDKAQNFLLIAAKRAESIAEDAEA